MFSCRFYLFCLLGILSICLCDGNSNVKKCAEGDRQALLKFKDGLINGKHILSEWNGDDCCKWDGVECDDSTGHVTRLDLGGSELRGKIDSSLCELQHLTSLDLSDNDLEGKIPKCIGSLGQLIELRLAYNILASAIPHSLGNLSNLQILDLSYNNLLVANDLEWVSYLSNLRYLDLSYTNLSQAVDWLPSINKLPSLFQLQLDECELPRLNMKSIPQMNSSTSLDTLSLAGNYLTSSTLSHVLNVSKVLTYLNLSDTFLVPNNLEWVSHLSILTYLDLSHNNLSQAVDWLPSINKLPSLRELQLDNCGLHQFNLKSIPQMNSSTSLEHLFLSGNYFNSQALSFVLNVSKVLRYLDLSHNELQGIPKSFRSWCQLETLTLSFNKLSGQLSDHIQNLCSGKKGIRELDLSHNKLIGTLPYTTGQFSNLISLSISSNKLNGIINEAHLSNLSKLEELNMDQNSLSFNLSSKWVPPFQLSILSASSCNLGPNFPSWLKHQWGLNALQISNSGISGSLPKWFWDLSRGLIILDVSHNKLSGVMPKEIPSMKSKHDGALWDFSFNNFSGPLPHFSLFLSILSVSNNMFSGSISSFCATSYPCLAVLDLSSNFLEGPLPDCWEKFPTLQVLNLATNYFSGRIPRSFGTLQRIKTIHLNNNNFSGEVPSLIGCGNLKFIDLGDNNLEGILPAWIGQNLHDLIVLRLRANKFQGSIPANLCDLLHLQVLDVSKNNISGGIPHCLDHIIALSKLKLSTEKISYSIGFLSVDNEAFGFDFFTDKAILAWKGANREYGKILGLMKAIDLSCNQLTGEIPHSVTKLATLINLNLSGNNLTGFIPNNIGHMTMLESLDLSRNYLYGRIPASLSNSTSINYMNLSFNNLSGNIPRSTQLETFDAYTYIGNPGLCGQPLSKKCPGDESSSNPQSNGNTNMNITKGVGDELISFGFYISLGLGFIIGFWGVCGTLVLKTSWRYAYFRFFYNMYDWIYVQLVVIAVGLKRRLKVQD